MCGYGIRRFLLGCLIRSLDSSAERFQMIHMFNLSWCQLRTTSLHV